MIPKIIHYCWFGKGEKNSLMHNCIESWKKYCPDYKVIEWNEDNFDLSINRFAKEAYEMKKYAFVSDYVRLYVLNEYGGVYVDTDLEIRKNIDGFLDNRAFSSFESKEYIPTAIMGAEKGHPWIKDLLEYYENRRFIFEDGTMDMTPNPRIITQITKEKYNLILNNEEQVLKDGVHIYPNFALCTNYWYNKNYSIHHFNGSWLDKKVSVEEELVTLIKYKKNYDILVKLLDYLENKTKIYFPLNDYRKIYLFGAGEIAKLLIRYFNLIEYKIEGIISREDKDTVFGVQNMHIDKIENLSLEDLIIITPSYDFNDICRELAVNINAQLVSIEHILSC